MAYPERLERDHEYQPPSDPESELTRRVEHVTANIPSSVLLGAALGAMALSLILQSTGSGKWGSFLSQWVPTWLLLGVYSKLLKVKDDHVARDTSDRGSYFL